MQSFQEIIFKLKQYWADRGAIIQEPYDVEVGAGTMCPETFLRVLGPQPYRVAYVQPSRRPADGRYGDNPNRLYKHSQLQVILKPSPDDIIEQYLASLEAIGIDLRQHDIKFEEDNWNPPRWAPGASAGRSCWTAWRSPSSPISSNAAASIWTWFRLSLPMGWSASWPSSR